MMNTKRKPRDRCRVSIWINGPGLTGHREICGRPLPCLFHTGYQPEFPPEVHGPRRATFAEIDAGKICGECLCAVCGPTKGIRCTLWQDGIRKQQTCDAFTLPQLLAGRVA